MASTIVIDLGERWSVEDEEDRPARPASVRRPVAYLVGCAAAVLLTAAAPNRPQFEPLAEIPAGQFQAVELGPGAVYVAGPAGSRGEDGAVAAYRVPGGGRSWVASIPGVPGDLRYGAGARVLVATEHDNFTGRDTITALDAGTGKRLWTAPYDLVETPAGTTGGLLARDPGGAGLDIRWVDLRTGRVVWSRHLPERSGFTLVPRAAGAGPGRVLLTGPDGLAELVDEASGAVLSAGPLGALDQLGDPDGPRQAVVSVVGDRVLVLRPPALNRPASLSAFGLADLTPQWTVTGNFDGYPDPCGHVICLNGGYRLTAVDPVAGTILWATSDWQGTMVLDADHVVAFPHQAGAPMGIIDLRTGRTVMTVRGWQLVTDLTGAVISLLVAPDVRQYGHYWFGVPDLRRGDVRPLGYVPGVMSQDCQVGGDLLLCRTLDRTVQIWRYRT